VTVAEVAILGIDLGTTEIKAGLVTPDGTPLGFARAAISIDVEPSTGRAEQDPETWWAGIRAVTLELLAERREVTVSAICCVGQGPTMVPVDASGRVTHPALTWMDGRPTADTSELEAATGLTGWGLGVLPAARWLERHEPATAERTRWYLNSWEWVVLRLTDTAIRTRSLGQLLPEREQVARAGLVADRLPRVEPAGSLVGSLTASAAAELGLSVGTRVVAGTVDSFASLHGAGLTDPGDAVDTGGTSGGLAVYWDAPVEIAGSWVAPAPLPDRWLVGGAMTATGKALDWYGEAILGGGVATDDLIDEAELVSAGAEGLLFLPYLAGERSPIWDPNARGTLLGLTLSHGRAHVTRAILEAAAFALRHVASPILAAGLRIEELRVTGGTARNDTWNQIKADVVGVPVAVPSVLETAVLGAGILAAVGIGWQPDVVTAIGCMVRMDHRLAPKPTNRPRYDQLFDVYAELWPRLATSVHRLHDLARSGA
jgi:xylulokinase